jgi:hypothetical protein
MTVTSPDPSLLTNAFGPFGTGPTGASAGPLDEAAGVVLETGEVVEVEESPWRSHAPVSVAASEHTATTEIVRRRIGLSGERKCSQGAWNRYRVPFTATAMRPLPALMGVFQFWMAVPIWVFVPMKIFAPVSPS